MYSAIRRVNIGGAELQGIKFYSGREGTKKSDAVVKRFSRTFVLLPFSLSDNVTVLLFCDEGRSVT